MACAVGCKFASRPLSHCIEWRTGIICRCLGQTGSSVLLATCWARFHGRNLPVYKRVARFMAPDVEQHKQAGMSWNVLTPNSGEQERRGWNLGPCSHNCACSCRLEPKPQRFPRCTASVLIRSKVWRRSSLSCGRTWLRKEPNARPWPVLWRPCSRTDAIALPTAQFHVNFIPPVLCRKGSHLAGAAASQAMEALLQDHYRYVWRATKCTVWNYQGAAQDGYAQEAIQEWMPNFGSLMGQDFWS